MASPTQCTWVWASSERWLRTGKPGVLQSMGSQRVRHDWATEQQTPVQQAESWSREGRQIGCADALSAMHAAQAQRIGVFISFCRTRWRRPCFLCVIAQPLSYSVESKRTPGGPLLCLEDEQNTEWERLVVFSTARPLEASWLPHQVLCWDLMLSSHFISPTVLWGRNHCPHFPHGETEDWRVESGAQVGGAQVFGRQHSLGWGAPGRPAWWQRASSLICLQNPQKDKTHGLTVMAQARVPRAGPQAALAPARVSEQRHA